MPHNSPGTQGTCSQEDCEAGRTGTCARGEATPSECSLFTPSTDKPEPQAAAPADHGRTFRSGIGLGYLDASELMRATPTFVVPIVGLSEAGKTCYLVSLYSLCLAGRLLPQLRFAGSTTLVGFETLIRGLRRWDNKARADRVVPHTSSQVTGREPSFLHLSLQETCDDHRLDILFSDVPGEWFEALIDRPASVADDKLGFIRRADSIAFLADGPRIMDPSSRHVELANLRYLFQRTSQGFLRHGNQVPAAILITKMDDVPETQHHEVRRLTAEVCSQYPHNWETFICAAVPEHPDVLTPGTGVKEALLYLIHNMVPEARKISAGEPPHAERTFLALTPINEGRHET